MFVEMKRSVEKNYLYTQQDENLNFFGHVHNSFEFVTVTEGRLECMVYDGKYVLERGKALLIMPNHVHRYASSEHSKSFLCVFSPDYVIDFYNDVKRAGYVDSVFDYVDDGGIALLQSGESNKYLVRSVLYGICGKALDNLARRGGVANSTELEIKIIDYIQQNYDNELSLKQMAADLGYNYSYLSDTFNKVFGCGFSRYVYRLRVEDAAELLKLTDESIAQICVRCGFNNIGNLNLRFKQVYGKTPTEYRRAAKTKAADKIPRS